MDGGFVLIRGLRESPPLDFGMVAMGFAFPVLSAGFAFAVLQRGSSPKSTIRRATLAGLAVFLVTTVFTRASEDEVHGFPYCLMAETVLTAASLAFMMASMRNAFAVGARGRAVALGLASGLAAAAVIRVQCPNDDLLHVLIAHGAPIAVAMLAAAAL